MQVSLRQYFYHSQHVSYVLYEQDSMPIHQLQKWLRPTYLAWNVDCQLSYPSLPVKYQMGLFSKQLRIMIRIARGSCTNWRSGYCLANHQQSLLHSICGLFAYNAKLLQLLQSFCPARSET